jgi:glycosyltransferase involved in cell wall biosynthesis
MIGAMVSIVVPVYNERDALMPLAGELIDIVAGLGEPWEAIFVDDGSNDGSADVLRELARTHEEIVVVRLRRNFGKSAALTAGFAHSRGERIVTLDADGQDDPREIPTLLAKLDEGYELVSGWKQTRRDPFLKRVSSRVFNRVTALLSGVRLHDFNCGLKAYRGREARDLPLYGELHRYIPVIGAFRGWRVTELPVNHRPRAHGRSKFGAERYLRGLFDLITVLFLGRYRQRPLHLFGGLGLSMFAVGFVICAYLTVLKIGGEAIGRRPLLLFGVLLLVVGVQFLSLGLISEMVAAARADQLGARASDHQVDEIVRHPAADPLDSELAATPRG